MSSEDGRAYERFVLFGYDDYYPGGGESEVIGSFPTMEDVLNFITDVKDRPTNMELLDLDDRRWVDLPQVDQTK